MLFRIDLFAVSDFFAYTHDNNAGTYIVMEIHCTQRNYTVGGPAGAAGTWFPGELAAAREEHSEKVESVTISYTYTYTYT